MHPHHIPTFMLLTTALASLFGAVAHAMASASGSDSLLVCTDANFSGSCALIAFDGGQCVAFPSQFQHDVSTVSPPMSWECALYTGINCDGDKIDVVYPGIRDLGDGTTSFNDRLNSFTCRSLVQ